MVAFPKPVKRVKVRKPLRSRRRRRPRVEQIQQAFPKPTQPDGTKHRRRPRELGYMAFCRARGCELLLDLGGQKVLGIVHRCRGPVQFAHLSDLKRYDVGDIGAGLCRDEAHQGIDGKEGGKAPWYVALDWTGQHTIRMRLANRARAAWDALTPEDRATWDARAAAELAREKPRRGRRVISGL